MGTMIAFPHAGWYPVAIEHRPKLIPEQEQVVQGMMDPRYGIPKYGLFPIIFALRFDLTAERTAHAEAVERVGTLQTQHLHDSDYATRLEATVSYQTCELARLREALAGWRELGDEMAEDGHIGQHEPRCWPCRVARLMDDALAANPAPSEGPQE